MSCYNSIAPSSPPQFVIVKSNNQTSLDVSWQPPLKRGRNGPITGYVINYTRVGSNDVMSVNVTTGTTHVISRLVTFAEYSVGVAAMNVNGTGPFSFAVTGRPGGAGEFYAWKYVMLLFTTEIVILFNYSIIILTVIIIKTHGSESRGQVK